MLTKGDDYPIHQTPEPIAFSGSDRNFYDRYFFNGYSPDGSFFFAAAFGVYPHVNVADAHFSVVLKGRQYNLHASRELNMERMDISVGPIRIEIIEPLKVLRLVVEDSEGVSADLTFTGRSFPIEEPRFIQRIGPRMMMDYTRMTQNGRYSGSISVDGNTIDVGNDCVGTRDRSWGIRPIGARDPQPHSPAIIPGFFWQWTPLNFEDKSVFFHVNAAADGAPFNIRACICPDGDDLSQRIETSEADMTTHLQSGTRHATSGELEIATRKGLKRIRLEPFLRFQMKGIGYLNEAWGHGHYKGPLVVDRDEYDLEALDLMHPEHLHIQALCKVTMETDGGPTEHGLGVFEQLVLGPYQPWGLEGLLDPAP